MVQENSINKHFKLFITIFIIINYLLISYAKPNKVGADLGIPGIIPVQQIIITAGKYL